MIKSITKHKTTVKTKHLSETSTKLTKLNKGNKSRHETKTEKGKRKFALDWLNKLEIHKLEPKSTQNKPNLPIYFPPNAVL